MAPVPVHRGGCHPERAFYAREGSTIRRRQRKLGCRPRRHCRGVIYSAIRSRSDFVRLAMTNEGGLAPALEPSRPGCRNLLLDELALPQLVESLLQFFLRVHDDGPVPGDRFFDRLARYQKKANAFLSGLYDHFVAAIEQY